MIKKSLKYVAIVLTNLILLFILLDLWVDAFEWEFNEEIFFSETFKLIGITVVTLMALRIVTLYYKNWSNLSSERKILMSIMIVVLINGKFYIDYSENIYQNQFINKELRESIMNKITPYEGSWFGYKAENLTSEEYKEITKVKWFPELPKEAKNISYDYEYEGFLPDYSFSLIYDVPLNTKVDTMKYNNESFSKSRSFEVVGNMKRVTYSESQW